MDDAVVTVLAHGMMSSMTIVRLSLEILRREGVDQRVRDGVAADAAAQVELIVDALGDLARGFPVEALLLLQPRLSGRSAPVRPGREPRLASS